MLETFLKGGGQEGQISERLKQNNISYLILDSIAISPLLKIQNKVLRVKTLQNVWMIL